jgi:hypothetical protein
MSDGTVECTLITLIHHIEKCYCAKKATTSDNIAESEQVEVVVEMAVRSVCEIAIHLCMCV